MNVKSFRTQHRFFAFLLAILPLTATQAQTNVSDLFLQNWGFDTDINYGQAATGNVAQEILDIQGWTKDHGLDYTIVGTYAFGTNKTFNTYGKVPAEGYDGSAGCLAFSTGWDNSLIYSQAVTLPAGTYTIQTAWWNGSNQTAGQSIVGWIPNSGTSVLSSLNQFNKNVWTTEEQTFTLSGQKTGKIQIGFKSVAGASSNSAKVVLDYVKILMDDAKALKLVRSRLKTAISTANKLYGEGTGISADVLKQHIDVAQAAYDDEESVFATLLECYKDLTAVSESYTYANASESSPLDITSKWLVNNDFESGTTGWQVSNLKTQTNKYFTKKHSNTYLETWTSIGNHISDAYVKQVLKALPRGKYRLTARGLHIQQKQANSVTNNGNPQTGAVVYAGDYETPITTNAAYTLNFAVLDENEDVTLGARLNNPTGNWFCIDYFQLYYTGGIDAQALASNLQILINQLEAYLSSGVQNSVREAVNPTLTTAREVVSADPLDESALQASISEMKTAISQAEASHELYANLREAITYASKVLEWWRDVPSKATAWAALETAIATAEETATDYSLTDTQLQNARNTLNTRVKAVDKKIYENSQTPATIGNGTALNNPESEWAYARSAQSKHWILFWDKGYESKPSSIDGILETVDQIFEFYADSLKYITINQGSSKTDSYKMIIRLRSSEDWEASGSGIDHQIGLLTLSRWAFESRGGQTMAHEIGHCFQYQVHCDNGDMNGWMYNWGTSSYNVFWEMCAQWQAYKFYPDMQFDNEWLTQTLNGLHRHPLSVHLRYNNYFIQDYMCHRHGMDFLGKLWNKSRSPEDPLQAYMRLTMTGTTAKKLELLGTEMWEYGARMTTFDMDQLCKRGANTINKRNQTALTKDADGYWWPTADNCIENWGNNAIRLNVPANAKTVYADFEGKAGADGYTNYNKSRAGWRIGFVALQQDGTRVYGDVASATTSDANRVVSFECPDDCSNLWLVVSGAPTAYWTRDWVSWDEEGQTEQWPYRVHFYQTNVYGQTNDNGYPVGISDLADETRSEAQNAVYSISGQVVRQGTTSVSGLPRGIYIVNGRKVAVR